MALRFLILFNPAARGGRNRHLRGALEAAVREAGLDARIVDTRGVGDAEHLARTASADVVVAAGGDGTIHEVVNGLVGTGAALGVLPFGTGNDFARALGVPAPLADAVRALADTEPVPIDAGRVRWEEPDGPGGSASHERLFANCLGMGFDAHAAFLAARTKWIGGRAAYLAAVLRTLWVWRRPSVHARVALASVQTAPSPAGADGLSAEDEMDLALDGPLFLCEVGNGHSVGGGFLLTPDARPDDGLLDVCLVRHLTTRRALHLLPQTFTGAHVGAPEVRMDRTRHLVVDVVTGALALQADGEALTFAARRVEVEMVRGVLDALAPGLA